MKRILRAILSLLLIVYLIVITFVVHGMATADRCTSMTIIVNDTSSTPFVTVKELERELHGFTDRAPGRRLVDIDTDSIRSLLSSIDKIESVEVVRNSGGAIVVNVVPMKPVARVFDGARSYYINREGKRMKADARYRVDVPVVHGHFTDSVFPATSVLPLLDYIKAHRKWDALVSMVKVDSPTDVYLIPSIRGQVIAFGTLDKTSFDDKFNRLDRMYADVLPVKGWNYYDTISVKWGNQVVATRRDKKLPDTGYVMVEEDEEVDISTMLADDNVAPGQALPGSKAKNEKPIPAAAKRPAVSADTTAKTQLHKPKTEN